MDSLLPFPNSRSRQAINRNATTAPHHQPPSPYPYPSPPHSPFHSNPSCSLKNSRNAGSSPSVARSFVPCSFIPALVVATDLRRSTAEVAGAERERQIWASRPSSWRRPLRILTPSKEERWSKERERRDSIVDRWGLGVTLGRMGGYGVFWCVQRSSEFAPV